MRYYAGTVVAVVAVVAVIAVVPVVDGDEIRDFLFL